MFFKVTVINLRHLPIWGNDISKISNVANIVVDAAVIALKKIKWKSSYKLLIGSWALARAQLVDRSLPTLEVRGLIQVIGQIYIEHLLSTALKRL